MQLSELALPVLIRLLIWADAVFFKHGPSIPRDLTGVRQARAPAASDSN
jgi:hypothetical protein